jgi:hypothetical protein
MFHVALVLLIKANECPTIPSIVGPAIGWAQAFGIAWEHAKDSSLTIDDLSKYHVTVATNRIAII